MWDKVLGHTEVKQFLARYLTREERPHALLFCGAEGLGKKKLALEFARSLLCFEHSDGDGCESCRLMQLEEGNLSHPDFLLLQREEDPKTHRLKDISIDQVRELVSKSAFAPVLSAQKVCLVEDVDRMTEAAANSFLKLLEEPPTGWVFLLLATSPERLLPTILSRVVQLRLHRIPLELVAGALQNKGLPEKEAQLLASLSEGSLGLAWQYHEQQVVSRRQEAYAFLEALPLEAPLCYLAGRDWLEKYERPEALLLVQLLQLLFRDVLVCCCKADAALYNIDLQEELLQLSQGWSSKKLKQALQVIQDTYVALITNAGVKLAMENMALKIDKICKE